MLRKGFREREEGIRHYIRKVGSSDREVEQTAQSRSDVDKSHGAKRGCAPAMVSETSEFASTAKVNSACTVEQRIPVIIA